MNGEPSQCLCWAANTTTIGAMETCPVHGDSGRHYIGVDHGTEPSATSITIIDGNRRTLLLPDVGAEMALTRIREAAGDALTFRPVEFPTDNLAARIRGWDPRATWHNGTNRAQRRAKRRT